MGPKWAEPVRVVTVSRTPNPLASGAPRLALVDAFRGLASLSVVLFHVYRQNLITMTNSRLPQPFDWLFSHGNAGVFIFFALSGYVIALSIRGRDVDAAFVGRFALRRSLRLDPPYWVTIALAVAAILASNALLHDREPIPVPGPANIAANVFYAQYFLGEEPVLGVFWTLCLELQFYLVLVVGLALAQRMTGKRDAESSSLVLFVPLFVVSAAASVVEVPALFSATFLSYWYCFFTGVLACWAPARVKPAWLFGALAVLLLFFVRAPSPSLACAVATPAILYVGGVKRFLDRTGGRALQLLGAISYSLYLTHMIAGTKAVRLAARFFPQPLSTSSVAALVVIGVGSAVLFALTFYKLVEQPSLRLSRRVALTREALRPSTITARAGTEAGVEVGVNG